MRSGTTQSLDQAGYIKIGNIVSNFVMLLQYITV